MCGIAGILGKIDPANRDALERMHNALLHRGPDACGIYVSTPDDQGNGLLMAHRRLSILDLSPAADQPMTDPTSGQVIAFNGEIYNYLDLRRCMESQGESFTSSGDTAVLLRWLALHGPAACSQLRGMFAVALWDDRARRLMLARDPLGIKPLYLAINPDRQGTWRLAFASELRALLAGGLTGKPRLNPLSVESFLWNGFVPGPASLIQGIRSLEPGHFLEVTSTAVADSSVSFWNPPPPTQEIGEEELGESLRESVRLHLASDVPLGVFLSGGVDSGAVANLARRESNGPIHTFTLAFEDPAFNEGEYARAIAAAIGTEHREILLTESEFLANLDRALGSLDQPTFDGLNSFYMSQAVRQAGLTVALVGTGGDELFGGYTTFRDLPKLAAWSSPLQILPQSWRGAIGRRMARGMQPRTRGARVPPQTRWAKLPDMLEHRADLLALYQLSYALFLPAFRQELLSPELRSQPGLFMGLPISLADRLREETAGRTPLNAISRLEQRLFLGERLLRDSDAASMAVSLEMRLPLVDSVLLTQVNRLNDTTRYHPARKKMLLRKIGLQGLDPALFDRPKSGFVLPFDRWIRRQLGPTIAQTMTDTKLASACGLNGDAVARLWNAFVDHAPGLYWSRIWSIYVLLDWCRRHDAAIA